MKNFKKHYFFLVLFFSLMMGISYAQAPQGINYQAVVRDNSGNVIASSNVGMRVQIRQGSVIGTIVYAETFTPTTNALGMVNLIIGQGTAISGNFSTINWAAGPYFCELGLDVTGGASYIVMGSQQFMSVPYALYAATSGSGGGGSYTAGTGINITGTVISNTGDVNATDDITNSTTAGGDLTGTYPNPSLINSGVTPGVYGSGSLIPVLTIDGKGRVTSASTIAAGGGGSYTAGTGINITGTVITNTGDVNAADDITNSTMAGGDLTGTYPTPSLINSGVVSGTYGSTTLIPVLTVDSKGRLTSVTTVAAAGGGGVTLDGAYDFGGPGAGRTITVDNGPVQLNGSGTNTAALGVLFTGTGNAINAVNNNPANTFSTIQATTNSTTLTNSAIFGSTTGTARAIAGQVESAATADVAVRGLNLRTTAGIGVEGVGFNGVSGSSNYNQGFGVFGSNTSTPNTALGYYSVAVAGVSANGIGVRGQTTNGLLYGMYGQNLNTGIVNNNVAIYGLSSTGVGVVGENLSADYYGVFSNGDFGASGTKAFVIDHPSDPTNKYLKHFSIESDEVLNMYRGTITCDANGEAVVILPDYVELVNKNYSYHLTTIGGFAPVFIKEKITNGQFKIAGGTPGMEISWQVISERNDLYLQQHPEKRAVVVEKREGEKGTYLMPGLYNQPTGKKTNYISSDLLNIAK